MQLFPAAPPQSWLHLSPNETPATLSYMGGGNFSPPRRDWELGGRGGPSLKLTAPLPTPRNRVLVIAIVFQVCLGNFLCYCPGMPNIFNFMPIR